MLEEFSPDGANILSRLLALKKPISIELNDENTSLSNCETVKGLEALKRRILKEKGFDIVVITTNDISNCSNDIEIVDMILSKLPC